MAETTDELLARMAAKYGLPNAAPSAGQTPRPQPAPQPAPQAPQQPRTVVDTLRGRAAQIDKAAGYALGGFVDVEYDDLQREPRNRMMALPSRSSASTVPGNSAPNYSNEGRGRSPAGPGSLVDRIPDERGPDSIAPRVRSAYYGNEGRGTSAAALSSPERSYGNEGRGTSPAAPSALASREFRGGVSTIDNSGDDVMGRYQRASAIQQSINAMPVRGGAIGNSGSGGGGGVLDRALTPYAGSGGQLTANQLRIAAQLSENNADRGYKFSALNSQDQNAALDRALKGELSTAEESGRNARFGREWESRGAMNAADLASREKIAGEGSRSALERAKYTADTAFGAKQSAADRRLLESIGTKMDLKDPNTQKLLQTVNGFLRERRDASYGQSSMPAGTDDNYAGGGLIPPTMPQVLPEVNEYRNYALAAKALGAQPVAFDQFAQLRSAARLQTQMQNQVAMQPQQPEGFSEGGAIDVSGRKLEGPGTGTSDSIPAVIDGQRPAALSSGEFVVPAAVVKRLGTKYFDDLIAKHTGEE